MIPTKRNHFYTKEIISNAVGVRPQFKDLPGNANSETTLLFKGGVGTTQYVVSGNVSETPPYGDSELRGGYFQTYVTGMAISGTNMFPALTAYKLQNGLPISEGALSLSTGTQEIRYSGDSRSDTDGIVGDKWWVSESQLSPDEIWLEENFDGTNKSLGSGLNMPAGGGTFMTMDDAYVTPKEGADVIWAGGDAFFGGGGSNSVELNLGKYFAAQRGSTGGSDANRVYVRPYKKNRTKGLWTSRNDWRKDDETWKIYAPFWKWDTIKGVLSFAKEESVPADEGADTPATANNTIFNKVSQNGAGREGGGFILSKVNTNINLVSSEDGGMGQSMKFTESWGSDPSIGAEGNLWSWSLNKWTNQGGLSGEGPSIFAPCQTQSASIYDIPYPLPNNIGAISQTSAASGAMAGGDQRIGFPEINLNMKIDELLPSPALKLDQEATSDDTKLMCGTNIEIYGTRVATNQINTTGACGELLIGSVADILKAGKTFWRSIVITFSNYKPEDVAPNCSFDQFIDYGLKYAYGGKTREQDVVGIDKYRYLGEESNGCAHLGHTIVGGLVFQAMYDEVKPGGYLATYQDGPNMEAADESVVYAYTLPVARFNRGTGYNNEAPLMRVTGSNTTNPDWAPTGALVHRPDFHAMTSAGTRGAYPYVKIPKKEFFKVKFVFDVQQPWTYKTSDGWYLEQNTELGRTNEEPYGDLSDNSVFEPISGVPLRAYFPDTIPNKTFEDEVNPEIPDSKVPYINIAFPAEDFVSGSYYMCDHDALGNSMQTKQMKQRGGGTNYFPKHMTIWVNNVGVAPAATQDWWGSINANPMMFDGVNWVSDDKRYQINGNNFNGPQPILNSMSLDTIEFKNWTAPSTNISVGAGKFSRFLKGVNTPIESPAAKITSGSSSDYAKGFGADGTLNPIPPGQTITLGVKGKIASGGPDWLPIVNTTAGAGGDSYKANNGYLLFNNFTSKAFGQLQRTKPSAAWISTANEEDNATMGDFSAYPGMGMAGIIHILSASGARYQATQGANSKVFIETGSTDDPDTDFDGLTNPVYTTNPYICMGYSGEGNWLGTDGLTQKGFMKIAVSSGSAKWVPRENVLTSAKVMAVAGTRNVTGGEESSISDKNLLKVDNIDLFHLDLDDEYVIYRAGLCNALGDGSGDEDPIREGFEVDDAISDTVTITGSNNRVDNMSSNSKVGATITGDNIPANTYIAYRSGDAGYLNKNIPTGSLSSGTTASITASVNPACHTACGYKYTVKLVDKDIASSTIKLQVLSGSTVLEHGISKADDGTTDLCVPDNLSDLYISPKRFWLNLMFSDENWDTERKYENVCMVGETPATGSMSTQLGSTYNEALYTYNTGNIATKGLAAILEKPWILGASEDSSLILSQDYGYGSYDKEKGEGGVASVIKPILNTHAYFPLSGVVDAESPAPNEEVSLVIGLTDEINTSTITIVGDDTALDTSGSTYYRPQYVWEYYDELPEVKEFKITPQFDVLAPDLDLYTLSKQQINNLKFTWSENAEDVWYRHLLIDTSGSIDNKYHRSSFWAPMNETGVNDTSSYFYYYLNDVGDKDTTQYLRKYSGTTPQMTIDGISGYAPYFKNSASSGLGPPCYILGDYTTLDGSYKELEYSMANEMGGSQTSNAWTDKWSLVIHCNPQWSDAASETRDEGMTICGVIQCVSGAQGTCRMSIQNGNSAASGASYDSSTTWNGTSTGGFDLLHVFMKNSRVYVSYCPQIGMNASSAGARPFVGGANDFESFLLSSSTSYKMDGTQPIAINMVWNKNKGIQGSDPSGATTIKSDDQFRLYVNGQLEDSASLKYGIGPIDDDVLGPGLGGGFGRSNYSKFFVGCVPGGSEATWDGIAVTNVFAPVGEYDAGADGDAEDPSYNYRMSRNGFQGKIEEIILYPYEVYIPTNGGEHILNTRTLDDYSSSGSSGQELNYTGRLFLYDYTNVRGKSADQVSSSNQVQWRVTGT